MKFFKKYLFLFAIPFALAALNGCQKEVVENVEGDATVEQTESSVQGRLVSASLRSVQSVDEAVQEALENIDQTSGAMLSDSVVTHIRLLRERFTGTEWQMQVYRIKYNTVDIDGNPIQLNGDVGFINETSGKCKRTLDAITLFQTAFNTEELTTTLYEIMVMPIRVLYNQVVVYPFYQGIGIDRGVHPVTISEPVLKARQSIDCELAAMELLDLLNVGLDKNYYTANMGISNGGATTLAAQYLLENDAECKKINEDVIRLGGTYIGEGCYSFKKLIPMLTAPVKEPKFSLLPDSISIIKSMAYIACLVGSYDTWNGRKGHYRNVSSVEDYFSEDFLKIQRPYWIKPLSILQSPPLEIGKPEPDGYMGFIENFRKGFLSIGDEMIFNGELKISDMINPELLEEDGTVNMEHPYLIDVQEAFAENDVIVSGWKPLTPLCLAHSESDDFVDIEQVREVYAALSNNGYNRNVKMPTVKGIDHLIGTFFFLIKDILAKEEPWE